MYPIGKATQILMKIALIYLMTKHFNSTICKETLPFRNHSALFQKGWNSCIDMWSINSQYIQQLSDTLGEEIPIVLPEGQQYLHCINSGPSTGTNCSLRPLSWASDAGRETQLICEIGQYIKSVLVFKPPWVPHLIGFMKWDLVQGKGQYGREAIMNAKLNA